MPSPIESSLKPREVEEWVDLWFYRPVGYRIARVCGRLGVHPNTVTVLSGLLGVLAGHLFYYPSRWVNLAGIGVFLMADLLDSADGQLARLSQKVSLWGRILDGVAGTLMFTSCYVHLCARLMRSTGHAWVWLLGALAGWSHSFQSSLADYYRLAYVRLAVRPEEGPMDRSWVLRRQYERLRGVPNGFLQRLLLAFYIPYVRRVEVVSPNFVRLLRRIYDEGGGVAPAGFAEMYRRLNRPLMKYYSLLATNLRIAVLFTCLLLDRILLFFLFEALVLNAVAAGLLVIQDRQVRRLLGWLRSGVGTPETA
ncbi:CDP-diacylglycerol--glycerol-3-phosphate 3-phosphatidyltransferase [bacterium HR11]|nr:CDP-diacylglycerol--glycerol-3-phosphate 3-phosphatidyltransferase [bacterium HR11]